MTRRHRQQQFDTPRTGRRIVRVGKGQAATSGTSLDLYEVYGAMTYDATVKEYKCEGKPVAVDTDTELYTVDTSADVETLWLPTGLREDLTGDGPSDSAAQGQITCYVGQRIYTQVTAGRREIVTPPLDRWRIELKDALSPGGQATAYFRRWTGAAYVTDTTVEIEVYDVLGVFRGRGKDDYSSPHNDGSFGEVEYWPDSNRWEIKRLTPHATHIKGLATGDWNGGFVYIDGHSIVLPTGAIITDQDPGGNITVRDRYNWDGSENDMIDAVWDESADEWRMQQKACWT